MPFAPDALTSDRFFDGRLVVQQPRSGYRAGIDPVFLAAAVPALAGECVLELGCGAGVASLCLGARVGSLSLTGLELQPDYAALARSNAELNGVAFEVLEGDLAELPAALRQRAFDHVIANPPYHRRDRGTKAADAGRETALGEDLPLALWVDAAARRLRAGGRMTVILRAERFPELLGAMAGRVGSISVLPLAPRHGRDAALAIVSAAKGGRAAFRLRAPFVLHAGPTHVRDGDDYTPEARAVLRDGRAIDDPAR